MCGPEYGWGIRNDFLVNVKKILYVLSSVYSQPVGKDGQIYSLCVSACFCVYVHEHCTERGVDMEMHVITSFEYTSVFISAWELRGLY